MESLLWSCPQPPSWRDRTTMPSSANEPPLGEQRRARAAVRWSGLFRPLRKVRPPHAPAHRPAQRRHRRPRRPRQDDARRRDAAGSPAPSAPTRTSPSGSWTRWTSSARRASRSSPRTPRCAPQRRRDVTINIVDTPGPRRLRRRGRAGAVDGRRRAAAGRRLRGPAAADPLRAAQGARGAAAGDPRDQQGRPPRRPHRRGRRTRSRSCSSTSTPTIDQLDFPIVYCVAREGKASLDRPADGAGCPTAPTSSRCSTCCSSASRRRRTTPTTPLQALVTNLDASPYLGRLALCRVRYGHDAQGPAGRVVPHRRHDRAGQASPSSTSPRRSTACRPTRPGRARSSPSPASPRSRSARRSPTPTTRARCRSSPSTSRACR